MFLVPIVQSSWGFGASRTPAWGRREAAVPKLVTVCGQSPEAGASGVTRGLEGGGRALLGETPGLMGEMRPVSWETPPSTVGSSCKKLLLRGGLEAFLKEVGLHEIWRTGVLLWWRGGGVGRQQRAE